VLGTTSVSGAEVALAASGISRQSSATQGQAQGSTTRCSEQLRAAPADGLWRAQRRERDRRCPAVRGGVPMRDRTRQARFSPEAGYSTLSTARPRPRRAGPLSCLSRALHGALVLVSISFSRSLVSRLQSLRSAGAWRGAGRLVCHGVPHRCVATARPSRVVRPATPERSHGGVTCAGISSASPDSTAQRAGHIHEGEELEATVLMTYRMSYVCVYTRRDNRSIICPLALNSRTFLIPLSDY
jgi:hypothetical protein